MFGAVSGVLASRNHIVLQPTFEGTLVSVPIFLYPDANTFRSNIIRQVPISYASTISTTFRTDLIANVPVSCASTIGTTFWTDALPIVPAYVSNSTGTTFSSSALPSVSISLKGADPTGPIDEFFASVALLLHGNGSNGSTTFIDSSAVPKTVSPSGNAQISTNQFKFGGSSMYFDGVGDFLTAPSSTAFNLATFDFVIEGWFYPTNVAAGASIMSRRFDNATGWCLVINGAGGMSWRLVVGGVWTDGFCATTTGLIQNNTWYHIAATRSGSTFRIFVNGVQVSTATNAGAVQDTPYALRVGTSTINPNEVPFTGYMDDVRLTIGAPRYTANFTPPTLQFPDS